MNNRTIPTNVIRVILIFIAQVLIFKQITFSLGGFASIHCLIYPMAILLMPVKANRSLLMVISLIFGLGLDMFYDSPGVHAATLVLTAYLRPLVIAFLEPFEGYNIDDVPTIRQMGIGWFVSYVSILLLLHVFVYFSVEAFSFVYFFEIFLNTIFSFIFSFLTIMILMLIFKTKY